MIEEKVKFDCIFLNVESIIDNFCKSNEQIKGIFGNVKKIIDDFVMVNYKGVVEDVQCMFQKFNVVFDDVNFGKGILGKFLYDDVLYNELVEINKVLQDMVNDIQLYLECYIYFLVLGVKIKGVFVLLCEEKKFRKLLDFILD